MCKYQHIITKKLQLEFPIRVSWYVFILLSLMKMTIMTVSNFPSAANVVT